MFDQILENIKIKSPLIHNITNYVTVNDCANILIACGASPIMSDAIEEVSEITKICAGLNINIGTLNAHTIEAMISAGKISNEFNHPTVLDPVGMGASKFRTDTVNILLKEISFSIIRGNISEIKNLALGNTTTKGVDANLADAVNEDNTNDILDLAQLLAQNTGAIIIITGATDIVAGKEKAYIIKNGHPMMSKITGSGCMLSAMTTAYAAANPGNILEAAAASVCAMGICGEKAYHTMKKNNTGNSGYRNYLIDEIYNLTGEALKKEANYEIR